MATLLTIPVEVLQLILQECLSSTWYASRSDYAAVIAMCRRIDKVHPRLRANMRSAFTAWCSEQGLLRCNCHDVLEVQALYEKFLGDLFWSKATHLCFDCNASTTKRQKRECSSEQAVSSEY